MMIGTYLDNLYNAQAHFENTVNMFCKHENTVKTIIAIFLLHNTIYIKTVEGENFHG